MKKYICDRISVRENSPVNRTYFGKENDVSKFYDHSECVILSRNRYVPNPVRTTKQPTKQLQHQEIDSHLPFKPLKPPQKNKWKSNPLNMLAPTPNDVLSGRGHSVNNHPGNEAFRRMLELHMVRATTGSLPSSSQMMMSFTP